MSKLLLIFLVLLLSWVCANAQSYFMYNPSGSACSVLTVVVKQYSGGGTNPPSLYSTRTYNLGQVGTFGGGQVTSVDVFDVIPTTGQTYSGFAQSATVTDCNGRQWSYGVGGLPVTTNIYYSSTNSGYSVAYTNFVAGLTISNNFYISQNYDLVQYANGFPFTTNSFSVPARSPFTFALTNTFPFSWTLYLNQNGVDTAISTGSSANGGVAYGAGGSTVTATNGSPYGFSGSGNGGGGTTQPVLTWPGSNTATNDVLAISQLDTHLLAENQNLSSQISAEQSANDVLANSLIQDANQNAAAAVAYQKVSTASVLNSLASQLSAIQNGFSSQVAAMNNQTITLSGIVSNSANSSSSSSPSLPVAPTGLSLQELADWLNLQWPLYMDTGTSYVYPSGAVAIARLDSIGWGSGLYLNPTVSDVVNGVAVTFGTWRVPAAASTNLQSSVSANTNFPSLLPSVALPSVHTEPLQVTLPLSRLDFDAGNGYGLKLDDAVLDFDDEDGLSPLVDILRGVLLVVITCAFFAASWRLLSKVVGV